MARMYAKSKGKSGSTKPHNESLPEWANTDAKAVTELIWSRKAGHSTTIGTILRDQHAVPDARRVVGKRISGLWQRITSVVLPEDMMNPRAKLSESSTTSDW